MPQTLENLAKTRERRKFQRDQKAGAPGRRAVRAGFSEKADSRRYRRNTVKIVRRSL